jgi:ABC-2 type transport system ATP-binding protein
MKVYEQCLYLAQMKGLSKAEAKKQLEYWFDWNQALEQKKIQELLKEWRKKIQFVVCVLHKPTLILTNLSGF